MKSQNLESVKRILKNQKSVLKTRFKIKDIGVFGSYARGEERPDSDIDILVEFTEPVGFFAFLDVEEYLEKILNNNVDLVTKKALKPKIGERVIREIVDRKSVV